jgi:flagellar hook-associated protein 2
VREAVTGLVEAYNDVIQEISTHVAYDEETKKAGVLAGTSIPNVVSSLRELMSTVVKADTTGNITSMYDLGVAFNRDGTLSLDNEVLDAALRDNGEGVEAFFLGDTDQKIEGFADLINERFRALTSSSGLVETEKKATQNRIDGLQLQIARDTERLDKKYESLSQQFIELDRYMNQQSSIANFLTGQFASLNGLANSKK